MPGRRFASACSLGSGIRVARPAAKTCRSHALDNWMWYNENGWEDLEKGDTTGPSKSFEWPSRNSSPTRRPIAS